MSKVSVIEAETMFRQNLSAMRKEYTRMRDIAQKRIKRLGESEFRQSKAYQTHPNGFQKLKDMDIRDLPKAFSELSKFISAKGSTVSGQKAIREKTIKTWNQQGIPLTKETYNRTISILEEMRKRKIVYGSDVAQNLARITLEVSDSEFNTVLDNLETFLNHTEELESYIDEKSGYQVVDMDDFIKEIEGW